MADENDVEPRVVVNVNHFRVANRPVVNRFIRAVGIEDDECCCFKRPIPFSQEDAFVIVLVIAPSLVESNDVHVAVVVDVAWNQRGRGCYLKGRSCRDLCPFVCCGRKGCKIRYAIGGCFVCGGVLNSGKPTGHEVLASVVIQVDGDRSAIPKTPSLRDEFGTVGRRSGERGADDWVVKHHEIVCSERHCANIHQSVVDGLRAVVCMEDDAKGTVFVVEERMMPCPNEVVPTSEDGIVRVFCPRSRGDVACVGIAYGVVQAAEVVAGIREVVSFAMLDDIRTLVDSLVFELPSLRCSKAFAQSTRDGSDEVVAQFCLPYAVAVGEAHEEDVGCAVLVDEDMRVYALLIVDKVLHLIGAYLLEGPFRGVGSSGKEVLVGREIHDVLALDAIDFRCPEVLLLCRVGFVESLSFVFPHAKVGAGVASDAACVVGAVGIIGVAVEQNVWVCQRNLALASLCLCEEG